MKKIRSENNRTTWRSAVVLIAGVFMLTALANVSPARADDDRGQAEAFGETYGEWSARWWQWQRSLELIGMNPVTDVTGEFCAENQLTDDNEDVWFLAGTDGSIVERDCTVPEDTAIFYPLINAIFSNEPGEDASEDEKREALGGLFELTCILKSSLDGVPTAISDITVRTQSPLFFDPIFGDQEAVSDGWWVMLPPLSTGEHVLEFTGALCSPDRDPDNPGGLILTTFFKVDVTYNLTILGEKDDDDDD